MGRRFEKPKSIDKEPIEPFARPFFDKSAFAERMGSQRKTLTPTNKSLFGLPGISIEGDGGETANLTAVDWMALAPEILGDRALLYDAVESVIGVRFTEDGVFEIINRHLGNSINFIKEYLQVRIPNRVNKDIKVGKINDKRSLISFLTKTKALNQGDPIKDSPYYCAVAATAIAFAESERFNVKSLGGESNYVFNRMKDKKDLAIFEYIAETRDIYKVQDTTRAEKVAIPVFVDGQEKVIDAHLNRGEKYINSIISKLLRKPEVDADSMVTDGIRMILIVRDEDDVMPVLTKIVENFTTAQNDVGIRFSSNGIKKIGDDERQELKNLGVQDDTAPSSVSSGRFTYSKLLISFKVPLNGEKGGSMRTRNIEIQVIPEEGNIRNDKGVADHRVMEVAKRLSVFSRIFGPFSVHYLDKLIRFITDDNFVDTLSIDSNKLKQNLIRKFLVKINYPGNKLVRYCTRDHIERWKIAGILPKGVTFTYPK